MTEFILEDSHPLEVKKNRLPLSFFISTPKDINNETIPIVVLHGYGDYANSNYMKSLHTNLTTKYNVSIITVNYTGTFKKVTFDNNSKEKPYDFLNYSLNINQGENKSTFLKILNSLLQNDKNIIELLNSRNATDVTDFTPYQLTLKLLILKIENNSCNGFYIIERLFEMGFKAGIALMNASIDNEYQDFGVIQSIDVLTAIKHIHSHSDYSKLNFSKLSIVGTSHGGYIASMCDKFAPNTFNTIVNNAGWLYHNEADLFTCNNVVHIFGDRLRYNVREIGCWSKDNSDINYFSQRHAQIRSLVNNVHITDQYNQTKKKNHKKYVFAHTLYDHLIPIEEKDRYTNSLKTFYHNIEYIRLDCESMIDGLTFKNLKHAAHASLKGLTIDYIIKNECKEKIQKNDFDLNSLITYNCTDGKYIIDFSNTYPKIAFIFNH